MPVSVDPNPNAKKKAYQLIGEFFFHWNLMELSLNSLVHKGLGLSELEGIIATANISLRDKINIAKTCVSYNARAENSNWAKQSTKILDRIGTLSSE